MYVDLPLSLHVCVYIYNIYMCVFGSSYASTEPTEAASCA